MRAYLHVHVVRYPNYAIKHFRFLSPNTRFEGQNYAALYLFFIVHLIRCMIYRKNYVAVRRSGHETRGSAQNSKSIFTRVM